MTDDDVDQLTVRIYEDIGTVLGVDGHDYDLQERETWSNYPLRTVGHSSIAVLPNAPATRSRPFPD